MTEQTENWGCPDWRDRSAYPEKGDSMSREDWKWQFLRRFPEYREFWGSTKKTEGREDFRWRPREEEPSIRLRFCVNSMFPNPCTDTVNCKFEYEYGKTTFFPPLEMFERLETSAEDALKFAAKTLHAPAITEQGKLISEGVELALFDISRPLPAQLERVKETLERLQSFRYPNLTTPKLTGLARNKWPRHLRVIDAKDQGATHEEIYEYFAEERTEGDDDALDEFYRPGRQPKAVVSQWHSQAMEVMEKVSRLL